MPKKDGSPTVAEKRAAGTNNASINQAAKAAGTFSGNVGKAPTPSPSPTPTPSPSSSEVRAGSVADNRAKAKASAQTMKEYKAANNITPKYTSAERQATATQTNGNIGTYDPNSVGAQNEKYSHNDIKALKAQGYSVNQIGERINELEDDANLGAAAQRLKDNYVNSLTTTPTPTPTPTTTPYTPAPTPAPTPSPGAGNNAGGSFDREFGDNQNVIGDNNTIGGNVNQGNIDNSTNLGGGLAGGTSAGSSGEIAQEFLDNKVSNTINQSFDREFGDNQNTVGDYNKIYGNLNQGNQDFSVNIGGGIGAAGGRNNMQNAAGYNALNENAYARSNERFNAAGRSQMAIDMAEDNIKVGEFVNNVNTTSEMMRNYYRDKGNNYMVGLFGDRGGDYTPPNWVAPKPPGKIKSEEDDD